MFVSIYGTFSHTIYKFALVGCIWYLGLCIWYLVGSTLYFGYFDYVFGIFDGVSGNRQSVFGILNSAFGSYLGRCISDGVFWDGVFGMMYLTFGTVDLVF